MCYCSAQCRLPLASPAESVRGGVASELRIDTLAFRFAVSTRRQQATESC